MWAEKSLKESNAFSTTLLESIPLPIFYGIQTVCLLGSTKPFEEFYGKAEI